MRKFLIKLMLFLSPFMALAMLVTTFGDSIRANPFNNGLQAKIESLVSPGDSALRIIVGGDSRAEGQIVPALLDSSLGVATVNVAMAGCDLVSLKKALEKNGIINDTIIFIIGVSSFQINDRTLEYGYLSPATLTELSLLETIQLFRHETSQFFPNYQGLLQRLLQALLSASNVRTGAGFTQWDHQGHVPLHGKKLEPPFQPKHREQPQSSWYRNVYNNGVRARIFSETLADLSRKPGVFVIFHPGMSPAWNSFFEGSRSQRADDAFSEFLHRETQQYANILFADFNREYRNAFPDSLYYDSGHLNKEGARLFTKAIADFILSNPRTRALLAHAPFNESAP